MAEDNLNEEEEIEEEPLEKETFYIAEYDADNNLTGYRTESGYFEEPPVGENDEIIEDEETFNEIAETFHAKFDELTSRERVKMLEAEMDALLGEE